MNRLDKRYVSTNESNSACPKLLGLPRACRDRSVRKGGFSAATRSNRVSEFKIIIHIEIKIGRRRDNVQPGLANSSFAPDTGGHGSNTRCSHTFRSALISSLQQSVAKSNFKK